MASARLHCSAPRRPRRVQRPPRCWRRTHPWTPRWMRPWCARPRPSSPSRRRSRLARAPLVRPLWLSWHALNDLLMPRQQICYAHRDYAQIVSPKQLPVGLHATSCVRGSPMPDFAAIDPPHDALEHSNRTIDFVRACRPGGKAASPSTGGAGGAAGQPAAVHHRFAGRSKLHTQGDPPKSCSNCSDP